VHARGFLPISEWSKPRSIWSGRNCVSCEDHHIQVACVWRSNVLAGMLSIAPVQYIAVTDEVSCSPSYPNLNFDFLETHDISSNEGRYPAVARARMPTCLIVIFLMTSSSLLSSEATSTGRLRLACEHFDARCRKIT
jgi:hypothetical protein